jgi:uncharacterized membrane protein YqjE
MERDDPPPATGGRPGGLIASLRQLFDSLLEIAQTRIELAASEYEEERERLRGLLLYGMITLFFFGFGVVLLTLFIILLFWEPHGLLVVGGFAAAYLVAGLVALIVLLTRARQRPRLFSATVAELRRDREQLKEPE